MAKKPKGSEMFYIIDGKRQDADLHRDADVTPKTQAPPLPKKPRKNSL